MNRRNLLKLSLVSVGGLLASKTAIGAAVCKAGLTPAQTEGPFYPVVDQVDKDADLVVVAGRPQIASGQIVIVEGVVTDQNCVPVENVLVEIWQACKTGRYNHPNDTNTAAKMDPNFQYWGKAVTNAKGEYRFRTIIPGAYPADTNWMRPPHIHFKVTRRGYRELTTQMYFSGEAYNDKDLILQDLSKDDQAKVIVKFESTPSLPHPRGTFHIEIEKLTRKS